MKASVAHQSRISIAQSHRAQVALGPRLPTAGVSLSLCTHQGRSEACAHLSYAHHSAQSLNCSHWHGEQGTGVEYDSWTCHSSSPNQSAVDASQHSPLSRGPLLSLPLAMAICQQAWKKLGQGMHRLRSLRLHSSNQLLAMGVALPVIPGNPVQDMLTNVVLMTGFWAWFLAQFAKIFTKRFKKGVWDIKAVIEPGGMPSSHSSLCSGVTTAIALKYGFGSPLFAVALAFSVIVMYDAMGVRRHAGKQAEVLNQVINELMDDHPIVGEIKLKEVLGHTPRQVLCGALLGVIVGVLYPSVHPLISQV